MKNLEIAFRNLRLQWFLKHLQSRPHERTWEDEQETKHREQNNKDLWDKYDSQTERIIEGEKGLPISPTCPNDLGV